MQVIKHSKGYRNIHWLLNEIEMAYSDLSEDVVQNTLITPVYDDSLEPIFNMFKYNSSRRFTAVEFKHKDVKMLELPKYDPKNIIVCYSGGKDSLIVIRHYQKMGYNVYAYHVRGINKGYTDEWKVAELAAEKFNFHLIIDSVSYSGQHVWIEHPMKNMILANMALNYGVQNNITTKVAVGNFRTSYLVDNAFDVCAGDCIDVWKMYENVVKRFIPKFKVYVPNVNFHTAYRAILKEPELLKYTISCITPNRFRNLFRERTEKNYKVELLPNRCGCCWKCAAEYIYFCDYGVLELNREYYIHCLEVLLHTIEQEVGYKIYSVKYVWDKYMIYNMKKSKMYEEIKDATVLSGEIKTSSKNTER